MEVPDLDSAVACNEQGCAQWEQRLTRPAWPTVLVSCLLFLLFMEVFANRQFGNSIFGADYRSFYAAGYLVRTHPAVLYDLAEQARIQNTLISPGSFALPYFHPAYEALIYAPFTLLPYRLSYAVFLAFNVALLALVIRTFPELATARVPLLNRYPGIALFVFAPVLVAVLQGQDSILFLLLTCCLWRTFLREKHFAAGCVAALMLFRFQLTLPLLAILFLQRRRLNLLVGFLASASLLSVLSLALTGRRGMTLLLQLLHSGSLSHDHGAVVQDVMAIHPLAMPNLFGLVYALGGNALQPTRVTLLVLGLSALVFAWTAHRNAKLQHTNEVFAAGLLCALLVSYHMYLHDLTLLIFPLALLRTRVAFYTGLATYVAVYALLFRSGVQALYWLALPVGLLLCFGAMRRRIQGLPDAALMVEQ